MEKEMVKHLMDVCFRAKKITELMPVLPQKMKARHIHVIDAIHQLNETKGFTTVSDVSMKLNVTLPSVTRLVGELVSLEVIEKVPDAKDKRYMYLSLTELGEQYYSIYVDQYHTWLAALLGDISEEDTETAIQVITTVYQRMKEHKMEDTLE